MRPHSENFDCFGVFQYVVYNSMFDVERLHSQEEVVEVDEAGLR